MHDNSTRALQNRRQPSAILRSLLAAALVSGTLMSTSDLPLAASSLEDAAPAPSTQYLAPGSAAHEIAVQIVDPGNEGLQLSARLDETGGIIDRDIVWQVRNAEGQIVSDTTTPVASLATTPGTYKVTAIYGSARFEQEIEVKEGNSLAVNFVFNVGAVRMLATIDGVDFNQPARNFIYANFGPNRGKLVTISSNPGEILRLAAGDYRVESKIEPGNAVIVTDVTVRPGILSSIDIKHRAGVARLQYAGAARGEVHWQILSDQGIVLAGLDGATARAALKPGSYQAEAQVEGTTMSTKFDVTAGQEKDITIGN